MIHEMDDLRRNIEQAQTAFCVEYATQHVPAPPESKLGFALKTKGKQPINGLRHPVHGETCGWYIWCGQDFSDAPDFFSPIHTKHVYEDYPELEKLLGLPPGYRFLLAGEYLDVWYDESLLSV
jgi:hypothetical protein